METMSDIWPTLEAVNQDIQELFDGIEPMSKNEYSALMGRYGSSHIRFSNRTQFKLSFLTIYSEGQERLRAKLRINTRLRNLDEREALGGSEVITNTAANPDTDPSTDAYEPLPYVNSQTGQKEKLSTVTGLYNWKHSVGGQAYNEFLDAFKLLFRVILREEITLYEQ